MDTDWSPFNDSIIASGSDDAKAFIWQVPEDFTLQHEGDPTDVAPVQKLTGHGKKIGHVLFNPAAENILATSSGDTTVKIWDIETAKPQLTLRPGDQVQSLSWSGKGDLLVTTSRDKTLRIWDPRQQKPAHEGPGHAGAKSSRVVWMGDLDRIATTGFSKMSDRQLGLWDIRAAREPLGGFSMLDSISGICMPFWDSGNSILYLAGKGDGNIRYYEYENDSFEYLTEYKSADPQRGIAFMPKRGVNVQENEVTRAFKTVNDSYIEPISFIVPRRAEVFQDDIYPPTQGITPGVSASEWLSGKTALPPKIDLESVYNGEAPKEVPGDFKPAPAAAPAANVAQAVPKKAEPTSENVKESIPAQSTAMRGPPPSMKDQGAAVSGMINKYADNDEAESSDDDDETSSFEEVPKPVERSQARITAPSAAVAAAKAADSAKPNPPTTATTPTPAAANSGAESSAAKEAIVSSVNVSLDRLSKVIRQQQIALEAQTKLINDLTLEVQSLKSSVNEL